MKSPNTLEVSTVFIYTNPMKTHDKNYWYEQLHVDADIEGIPRDPEAETLARKMRDDRVPLNQRIKRLGDFYRTKEAQLQK